MTEIPIVHATDENYGSLIAGEGYTLVCVERDDAYTWSMRARLRRDMQRLVRQMARKGQQLRLVWAGDQRCRTVFSQLEEDDLTPTFFAFKDGVRVGRFPPAPREWRYEREFYEWASKLLGAEEE